MEINKKIYKGLNLRFSSEVIRILKILNSISLKLNQEIFLVGGYVRDLLLGNDSKDLDFIVLGKSKEFLIELNKTIGGKLIINEQFLNGKILLKNDINIDITTVRKEKYKSPGALPIVFKGSLIEDIKRRDFTINSLLIDFKDLYSPVVIDYISGLSDLKNKRIRVLYKKSFNDDPTRIYRGIRLASKLNFIIEKKTLKLMKEALQHGIEKNVSADRLFNEVLRVLEDEKGSKALNSISKFGLFSFISNKESWHLAISYIESLENNIESILKQLKIGQVDMILAKTMLLLHKLDIDILDDFLNRISISKKIRERIMQLNKNYKYILNTLKSSNITPYKVYKLLEKVDKEEIICYIVLSNYDNILIERVKNFLFKYKNIKLSVSGKDLVNLGVKQGKDLGLVIRQLEEETINFGYLTKRQQLKAACKIIEKIKKE
jgi:tRNA nucleotidyltransferase/poly(A) polymerase